MTIDAGISFESLLYSKDKVTRSSHNHKFWKVRWPKCNKKVLKNVDGVEPSSNEHVQICFKKLCPDLKLPIP